MIWHSSDKDEVLNYFGTDKTLGLTNLQAKELYDIELQTKEKPIKQILKVFFTQISKPINVTIAILALICMVLANIAQNVFWPYTTALIMLIIGNFSYALQKYFANDTKSQVKSNRKSSATVLREGKTFTVMSDELVTGDIIILNEGDYIPADARLIETSALRCDEYALTGEVVDVEKDCDTLLEDITEIAHRSNMVFAGCSVTHGSAKAVVTEINSDTEIKRQYMLNRMPGASNIPYNASIKNAEKFSFYAAVIATVLICLVLVIVNLSRTELGFALFLSESVLNSICIIIAAVPETLPISAALIIWTAIKALGKKGIIFHKSSILEKASEISVICAEKTGVLTPDNMVVDKIFDGSVMNSSRDNPTASAVLATKLAILCGNGAEYDNSSRIVTDSSISALFDFCNRFDPSDSEQLLDMYPLLSYIPFDNTRRRMTSVNMVNGKTVVIVKGAPEGIIPLCTGTDNEGIMSAYEQMANEGLYVIAVAYRSIDEVPAMPSAAELEHSLIFAGLIGFADVPDSDIISAIEQSSDAGIRTVMTTGDSDITAKVLARRIGILPDGMKCISGSEIKEMEDSVLETDITGYSVFARLDQEDRYRIVKSFMHNKETVAVTGTRSYDAPVLRKADIGFAIDKNATDVAKNAADFIVSNGGIKTLLDVIKHARNLFQEIKKIIYYFLSCNFGELLALFMGAVIFSTPLLIAPQILLINITTDILPCISLGLSPVEDNILNSKKTKRSIFNAKSIISMSIQSVTICILSIVAFSVGLKNSLACAQTMALVTLVLLQIIHVFPCYSDKLLINSNVLKHKHIFTSSLLCIILVLIIVLSPLSAFFGMATLGGSQWLLIILFAAILFAVDELIKIGFRLYERKK